MTDLGGAASPRTEAGQRLASRELHDFDDQPVDITADIRAIEAEAAQEVPAPEGLRAALTEPDAHPFRWMLDGTPCWCVSADEPHEGWVHAPACQTLLRERLALALAATPPTPAASAGGATKP